MTIIGLSALRVLGIAAAAASPPAAQASPPAQMQLFYVREAGAESCPDEKELRLAVAQRLGYDPFGPAQQAAVVARVARAGDEFVGTVELVDERGTARGRRELTTDAALCDEMASAMALSISIAIDPEAARVDRAPEPPAEAPAPSMPKQEPSTTPFRPTASAIPAKPTERHGIDKLALGERGGSVSGSLSAVSMLGIAPAAAFGASFTLQDQRGPWSIGVGARVLSSPGAEVEHAAELHTTLAGGELNACFRYGVLESCALGLLGGTWARASRVAVPRTDAAFFGAFGARLGIVTPFSRSFALVLQAEALGIVAPISARVDGTTVWNAPRFAGTLASGLRLRFW